MSLLTEAKVLIQEEVAPGYCRLSLQAPEVALLARPGQFVHVRCSTSLDPLLRRPFSIHTVGREKGVVTLLYRVVGRGTTLLSQVVPGNLLSLLGPLGRGFSLPGTGRKAVLVAGGMGVAPLFFLLKELSRRDNLMHFFWGARSVEELLLKDDIGLEPEQVSFATDDGSYGHKGLVTDLLEPLLASGNSGVVYACGPPAMLKKVAGMLADAGVHGEVSLERQMGCGVGACLSCVCKIKEGAGYSYRRVCTEGPVFSAAEVVWE